MDKAQLRQQYEQIKGDLPESLRSGIEKVLAEVPDDLFTESVPTWGDGFGAEGYCPGGSVEVGKAADQSDNRLMVLGVNVNTWGVELAHSSADRSLREGGAPQVPAVHLTRDQWEQVKAVADRVFGADTEVREGDLTVSLDEDGSIVLGLPIGRVFLDPDTALAVVQHITACFAALAGADDPDALIDSLMDLGPLPGFESALRSHGINV